MTNNLIYLGVNSIYNKNFIEFAFDFLPQILFFVSVFGYLIFMIIFKWIHAWGDNPPNLLNIMINLNKMPEADGILYGTP